MLKEVHLTEFIFIFIILLYLIKVGLNVFSINKKVSVAIISFSVLVGGFIGYQHFRPISFTTYTQAYMEEDSILQSLTITRVVEGRGNLKEKAVIEQEEIIQKVLDDLLRVKLYKNMNLEQYYNHTYRLEFRVSTLKNGMLITNRHFYYVDETYVDNNKIVKDVNHLKTIRELDANNDLNWEIQSDGEKG
ncbi:hypothetical protein [Sutcliffiella rhizosphaerae]|uniref:DUF421 domain-containing protein n=1 Tax=Sutcliffiella rhizosphaerae TaxID=2880967 RepID=A0ABN8AEH5_9BACI|nr:hypothetical protein [Sutcliffiella rhizosphaerae]CAG9621603.1 hypothetical protein BACCIP111883_02376 [Sutcliffiella rhizosphaerae]